MPIRPCGPHKLLIGDCLSLSRSQRKKQPCPAKPIVTPAAIETDNPIGDRYSYPNASKLNQTVSATVCWFPSPTEKPAPVTNRCAGEPTENFGISDSWTPDAPVPTPPSITNRSVGE